MFNFLNSARMVAVALSMALAANCFAALATTARVFMKSDPESYVGGGLGAPSVLWTHGIDGVFGANSFSNNGVSISYQGTDFWNFDFYAPQYVPETNTLDGQPLKVGFYDMATRYPFNSPTRPGIDISGAGRGNNEESGWFQVLDVAFKPSGELERLAVNFKQFGENLNLSGPALYGELRFNSSIPIGTVVPEPESVVMMIAGLGLLVAVARRKIGYPLR